MKEKHEGKGEEQNGPWIALEKKKKERKYHTVKKHERIVSHILGKTLMSTNAGNGEFCKFDRKSCDSHNGNEFGKISSNFQMNANKLNTWSPAMLADLMILANVTNLAKYLQIPKQMQIS